VLDGLLPAHGFGSCFGSLWPSFHRSRPLLGNILICHSVTAEIAGSLDNLFNAA
jgi:hypothetical protein